MQAEYTVLIGSQRKKNFMKRQEDRAGLLNPLPVYTILEVGKRYHFVFESVLK